MIDRYRNYQPRQPNTRRRPNKKVSSINFRLLLLAAIVIFGGKFVVSKIFSSETQQPTASSSPKPEKRVLAEPISNSVWNNLNASVNSIINEYPNLDISVAVVDISSATKANYGLQDNFAGASTTKVLTAIAYLKQVEEGNRKLTTTIGGKSAKEHLRLMINQSDNNSWAALNRNLTYDKIKSYADSIGLTSYDPEKNLFTAGDQATLLHKLYSDTLLNPANKALLLGYMQNTNNEAMLPKVIPLGAKLYHKYGQLEDRLHDSGIIDYQNRPIALAIFTKGGASDGSNYTARTQLVQRIAKTVINEIYSIPVN